MRHLNPKCLNPEGPHTKSKSASQAAHALADLDEAQWAAQGLLGSWHPLRLQQLNHRFLRHAWRTL